MKRTLPDVSVTAKVKPLAVGSIAGMTCVSWIRPRAVTRSSPLGLPFCEIVRLALSIGGGGAAHRGVAVGVHVIVGVSDGVKVGVSVGVEVCVGL